MSGPYPVFYGVPLPPLPPRGRKKGSHDGLHDDRQGAIAKGVALRRSGKTLTVAARAVLSEHTWWSVSPEHIARLISAASKRKESLQQKASHQKIAIE